MKYRNSMALALGMVLGMAALPVLAADHNDHHDHDAVAGLTLNNGKKWETDQPLRTGMVNIRALVEQHARTGAGNVDARKYNELSANIDKEVNHIFQNCHLDKKADDALHRILVDIMQGSAAAGGKRAGVKRETGIVQLRHGLENYGKYFNHPGWRPL